MGLIIWNNDKMVGSKTDLISTQMKLFTHYRCVSYFLMSFAENQPIMFTKNVMNWKYYTFKCR